MCCSKRKEANFLKIQQFLHTLEDPTRYHVTCFLQLTSETSHSAIKLGSTHTQ